MARRSRKTWQPTGASLLVRWSKNGHKKAIVMLWGKQWQAMFKNRDNTRAAKTLFFNTKQEAITAGEAWLDASTGK